LGVLLTLSKYWDFVVVALRVMLSDRCVIRQMLDQITGAALPGNNETSAELTTAYGWTFTSCSARLSSQSRYRSLDQWSTRFNMIG